MTVLTKEVADALQAGKPVVALESTIISHGMPYPQNVQVAHEVEDILRKHGVTPATIAILQGVVHIGLSADELEYVGKNGSTGRVRKVSRRDVADVIARKLNGATTVSTTMMFARENNIPIFVTGGIGGVHRGVSESWDISADLQELSRCAVCCVCAGAKSILDLPKTLEVLETLGIPVVGYKTDEFPNFFTPSSGLKVPIRADSPDEVSRLIRAQMKYGGMVVCNPIPEEHAATEVDAATRDAIREATTKGIKGEDVTPFLLKRINEMTKGRSLEANIALVKHNAKVGAEIAKAYSASSSSTSSIPPAVSAKRPKVMVVGGVCVDTVAKPSAPGPLLTALPGRVVVSNGGVGRNIAEVLGRMGCPTLLISAVGDDALGRNVVKELHALNVATEFVIVPTTSTANFMAILDADGILVTAVADMQALDHIPVPDATPTVLTIADANLCPKVLQSLEGPVWFEPVSVPKSRKLRDMVVGGNRVDLVSPNWEEMLAILGEKDDLAFTMENGHRLAVALTDKYADKVVLTVGKEGAFVVQREPLADPGFVPPSIILHRLSPCAVHLKPTPIDVVNDTGAGDTLLGVTAWATVEGYDLVSAVSIGMMGASLTLRSNKAVSPNIAAIKETLPSNLRSKL